MKVFELMNKLRDLPAGADVQCVCSNEQAQGIICNVDFDGSKADDSFVNLTFDPVAL